jgi:hypothetical protein
MAVIVKKQFIMKVYDALGVFKANYNSSNFNSLPTFTQNINGGLSEMRIEMAEPVDQYAQPFGKFYTTPLIGDVCEFWIFDKEAPNGKIIYTGIHSGAEFRFNGKNWTWNLNFLPNHLFLAKKVLRNESDETTVNYSSNDPSDIIRDILDRAGTQIVYSDESIRDTGLSRTYEFKAEYCFQAIKKVADLIPKGWFFYIGADNILYLKNHDQGSPVFEYWEESTWGTSYWQYDPSSDSTVYHELFSGRHLSQGTIQKTMQDIVNRVLFVGGDTGGGVPLYKQYENTTSQLLYGLFEEIIIDERVVQEETAKYKSDRVLDLKNTFSTKATAIVADSNFTEGGYDIESLRIGDKVIIRTDQGDLDYSRWGHFYWGIDFWKFSFYAFTGIPYIIKKINYNFYNVELEMDFFPEETALRIEDVNRDLRNYRLIDIPNSPT